MCDKDGDILLVRGTDCFSGYEIVLLMNKQNKTKSSKSSEIGDDDLDTGEEAEGEGGEDEKEGEAGEDEGGQARAVRVVCGVEVGLVVVVADFLNVDSLVQTGYIV